MLAASISGLPAFIAYLALCVSLSVIYVIVYTRLTPMPEFELIARGNTSASLALGMSILGFSIPLASAVYHSAGIVDCLIWGLIALLTQYGAFFLAKLAQTNLAERIGANEMAAAIWLGFVSLAAGILSAASMSI